LQIFLLDEVFPDMRKTLLGADNQLSEKFHRTIENFSSVSIQKFFGDQGSNLVFAGRLLPDG